MRKSSATIASPPPSALSGDSHRFRCLACGTASPSYFYYYGAKISPQNIQLTQCLSCHSVVDRYMEREWLLVIMDLVLLRQEAYRHVFWNRIQESPLLSKVCSHGNIWIWFLSLALVSMAQRTILEGDHRNHSTLSVFPPWLSSLLLFSSYERLPVLCLIVLVILYVWTWIIILSLGKPASDSLAFQHRSNALRNLWNLVHCAIWIPLVSGTLLGVIVIGIWGLQPPIEIPLENLGMMALIAMWQISSLRVVLSTH